MCSTQSSQIRSHQSNLPLALCRTVLDKGRTSICNCTRTGCALELATWRLFQGHGFPTGSPCWARCCRGGAQPADVALCQRRKQPVLWLVGTQVQQGGCSRCWYNVACSGQTQADMHLREAVDWSAVRVVCCCNIVRGFPGIIGQSMAAPKRLRGMEGGTDMCVVGTLCPSCQLPQWFQCII